MSALNPSSVNTIRAITFLKEGTVTLLAAYLRIGRDGIVDNFCNGGMLTPIDLNTGTLIYPAVDGENIAYDIHPITKKSIIGFKIPQWEEVKAMAIEAAHIVPQVRYVGWDIAISEKGLSLIHIFISSCHLESKKPLTAILFSVKVPVLSEHITLTHPIVSEAIIFLTSAFCFDSLIMLTDNDTATIVGSPSGTAATISTIRCV